MSSFRGKRQLVHPDYELLPTETTATGQAAEYAAEFAAELIPVYPASAKISSWQIAKAVRTVPRHPGPRRGPAARASCANSTS